MSVFQQEIIESEIKLYLITEFAPGGELFEHIVSKSKLEEREAGRLFFQLLNAIEYIH
jgi:serine/threonine protein kinase